MANNEESRTPGPGPRAFGGPGGRGAMPGQKAKDFKSASKRLFKELTRYRVIIVIALITAIVGAILTISAPNQLSKITDEVSNGLVVNSTNMEAVKNGIAVNLTSDEMKSSISEIIGLEFTQKDIDKISNSSSISSEDKEKFTEIMKSMNEAKQKANELESIKNDEYEETEFSPLKFISEIPESVLRALLMDSTYNGINITVEDKIVLIQNMGRLYIANMTNLEVPESMKTILFKEFEVEGKKITIEDQYEFVTKISTVTNFSDVNQLYGKIMELPTTLQDLFKPVMNMDKIKSITIFVASMYLLSALFSYIQSIEMTNVSNKFAKDLRGRISRKINKLPLKYFDKHQTGDILSRVTNDVDTIAQSMNQSLGSLVTSITLFIGSTVMMFFTNGVMAFTAICASLIGFIGMSQILKRSQKYFVARQEELGKLNGHIEEIYSGLNIVKAYNGREKADKEFDKLNQSVCNCNRKSQFLSGLMQPLMHFIGNFGYVAVCIVGALLTMNEKISFGVIVAFIVYVRLFTNPLSQIAQALTSLQTTAAASERVFEFLDEEEMDAQNNITKVLDKNSVKGKIEFKNVYFQYDNNDKPTIYDFTATANPGQKIAIVGPTGAGKTTMVNLLMKFYNINSGDILIDGVSTKDLSRENIHDLFTMVLQDTWLFEGTIKENIVYNLKNVKDERVEEVCKEVGLHHFIKTLPNGYDSLLSESDSVSAGQRQLLTIARGMIEDSPFLILDEATSNVDTRTEELVQEAMDKLAEGKTSFIIAHRLSTIKNADLILVMKNGNIIEQGNHEELIAKNGAYAELYNSQFEL